MWYIRTVTPIIKSTAITAAATATATTAAATSAAAGVIVETAASFRSN